MFVLNINKVSFLSKCGQLLQEILLRNLENFHECCSVSNKTAPLTYDLFNLILHKKKYQNRTSPRENNFTLTVNKIQKKRKGRFDSSNANAMNFNRKINLAALRGGGVI